MSPQKHLAVKITNHNMKSPMTKILPRLNCLIFNHKEVNLLAKFLSCCWFGCTSQSFYQNFTHKKTISPLWLLNCDFPKKGVLIYKNKSVEKSSGNKSIFFFSEGKLVKSL